MAAGDITDELVSRVRSRIGEASENGVLTAHILSFLNFAQQDLAWRLDDAALVGLTATATGTASSASTPAPSSTIEASIPTDLLRERAVLCDEIQARRIAVSELDSIDHNVYRAPSDDEPQYVIWNGMLYIIAGDTTDHDYTLHYVKAPPDMDADTDPVLGTEHHSLLVNLAIARVREMEGNPGEKERLLSQYRINTQVRNSRWGARRYENIPGDAPIGGD